MKLMQYLSARQRLLLMVLVVLILLMLLLKGLLSDDPDTPQLTLPPLPQVVVAPEVSPNKGNMQQPTTLGSDLRLADKRPILASPGLTFATPETTLVTKDAAGSNNPLSAAVTSVVVPQEKPRPPDATAGLMTRQASAMSAAEDAAAQKAAQRKATEAAAQHAAAKRASQRKATEAAAQHAAAKRASQRKAAEAAAQHAATKKAAQRKAAEAAAQHAAAKRASQRKAAEAAAQHAAQRKAADRPSIKVPATNTTDSTKFAALPADAWLLQVAAAPNAELATRHCESLALPCVGYAASRGGKRVWILVVGPFSSRAAAISAITQLPETLQSRGPFPRSVASVRADIDK